MFVIATIRPAMLPAPLVRRVCAGKLSIPFQRLADCLPPSPMRVRHGTLCMPAQARPASFPYIPVPDRHAEEVA
jgi:hypothetical protein